MVISRGLRESDSARHANNHGFQLTLPKEFSSMSSAEMTEGRSKHAASSKATPFSSSVSFSDSVKDARSALAYSCKRKGSRC